jgi:hypothetical protein
MLTPRLSGVRPLARALPVALPCFGLLGLVAVAGSWGCQGPDTFLRTGAGAGGSHTGTGGSNFGVGGHAGVGGMTGGGVGGTGAGGSGTGGRVGTGGIVGTGGNGTAGVTGTGGRIVGTGGARDGGADMAGVGGMIVSDGGADADGSVVSGTGPCMGFCINPIVLTGATVPSTSQGTGATCYEATGTYGGGNCGNFVAPRTFSINGVVVPICTTGGNFSLPATRVNGGYCFQSSPGEFSYAYFGLF